MKTINVFLASSEELDYFRMTFGNLVRRLDDIYERRGVRIKLCDWEDYDAAYNNRRKLAQYNDIARKSDMFVAMYFVMQLQLLESGRMDDLKVENGNVVLGSLQVAKMDNLKFAAANQDYLEMGKELAELPGKIEEARLRLNEHPEDEDLVEDLQRKLDIYNDLKGKFEEHQKLLFQKFIYFFDEGRVRDAIIILDLAEEDASRNLEDYRQSREMTEEKRQVVFCSIEELLLKASSVMADASITIEQRIPKADNIYAQADEMALECDYDKEKYVDLLFEYAKFLEKYSLYDKALQVDIRLTQMCKVLFGINNQKTGFGYNRIGRIYRIKGEYIRSLNYYQMSLSIFKKTHDLEHPNIATIYNNIGLVYDDKGEYDKALEYYQKALPIREKKLGIEHPDTAVTYDNIGLVLKKMDDYNGALEYHLRALSVFEKVKGLEHSETATSYNNIGLIYDYKGDY